MTEQIIAMSLLIGAPLALLIASAVRKLQPVGLDDLAELKASPTETATPGRLWLNGPWIMSCPGCSGAEVKLPADLATLKKLSESKGPFKFTRTVPAADLPAGAKQYFFRGNGIAGSGKLVINKKTACDTIHGYAPFSVDITEFVSSGADIHITLETKLTDINSGPGREIGLAPAFCAGVFRELWIDGLAGARVSGAWLERDRTAPGDVLRVELAGASEFPAAIQAEIAEASTGTIIARFEKISPPFEDGSLITFVAPQGAIKKWSPASPELYNIKIRFLCDDRLSEHTFVSGLCVLERTASSLKANGRDIKLRGVIRSEHFPPYGASVPSWGHKKDAQAIKEIRINLAYCPDYPPHEKFLEECDRAGLFVVAEFPFSDIERAVGTDKAIDVLKSCLSSAARHPSFLWFVIADGSSFETPAGFPVERLMLGNDQYNKPGMGVVKKFVDLYSPGHNERTVSRNEKCGMLVVDFIDSEAGREPRNKRELRKAAIDLETLKAADRKGIRAMVIGRFFTWGIASGIYSINRTKKVSSITISSHIQTGGEGEMSWSTLPPQLNFRLGLSMAATCLFALTIIPMWRNAVWSSPAVLTCVQPLWHSAALFILAQFCGGMGLSLYFNWNRRALTGAAAFLGYSRFMRYFTSDILRAAVYVATNLYFIHAGIFAASYFTGAAYVDIAPVVLSASSFELLFAAYLIGPVDPSKMIAAVAIAEYAFLYCALGPVAAAIIIAVRALPLIAMFSFIERKDIFRI